MSRAQVYRNLYVLIRGFWSKKDFLKPLLILTFSPQAFFLRSLFCSSNMCHIQLTLIYYLSRLKTGSKTVGKIPGEISKKFLHNPVWIAKFILFQDFPVLRTLQFLQLKYIFPQLKYISYSIFLRFRSGKKPHFYPLFPTTP